MDSQGGMAMFHGTVVRKAGVLLLLIASILLEGGTTMATEGLTTIKSSFEPKTTMDRLEAEIKSRGLTVFARINHTAGAEKAGMTLRPTELLIFGNAKTGTPLMQANQTIGIDLPLKVLVWQDASGVTWLSYNEPSWLVKRHAVDHKADHLVETMTDMLRAALSSAIETP
jgi:uncharacterized protein (DUF302 family)